jgi:addiction module RelB/DinJ family antitoxin
MTGQVKILPAHRPIRVASYTQSPISGKYPVIVTSIQAFTMQRDYHWPVLERANVCHYSGTTFYVCEEKFMSRDTTVQFRMNSEIKEGAFAVFREMGISPSEAVRVFFKQVQKTRTLPFVVVADDAVNTAQELESDYKAWLQARLADTIKKLDSGDMESYPANVARETLRKRLAVRRTSKK